jgi:cell division protein FtsB
MHDARKSRKLKNKERRVKTAKKNRLKSIAVVLILIVVTSVCLLSIGSVKRIHAELAAAKKERKTVEELKKKKELELKTLQNERRKEQNIRDELKLAKKDELLFEFPKDESN